MIRKTALLLTVVILLTGCRQRVDSSTCLTEKFFYTLEDCAAYLAESEDNADYVLSADKKEVVIYQPAEIPAGYRFSRIRLSGAYVTYYYTADGYTRPERTIEAHSADDSVLKDSSSSPADPTITPAEEQNRIQQEINELGREGYIKKYGLSKSDLEEIEEKVSTFLIRWPYGGTKGDALLQDSIEKLSLSEYPDMPGYYGYEVTYPGVDEVLAYRVFWSDGTNCFSATVPASVFDEMYVSGQTRKSGGFLLGAEKKTFSTQELKLQEK